MKLNNFKILCILILFMLLSSFLIQTYAKLNYHKSALKHKFKIQRKHSMTKVRSKYTTLVNGDKKKHKDEDPLIAKIFDFTLGLLTTLPVVDSIAEQIEDALENSEYCDRASLFEAYKEGKNIRLEERYKNAVFSEEKLEQIIQNLPWKPSLDTQKKLDKLETTNPKKFCNAILDEKKRQLKENKNLLDNNFMLGLIATKQILKGKVTIEQFINLSHRSWASYRMDEWVGLKHYIKKIYLNDKSVKTLPDYLLKQERTWINLIKEIHATLLENKLMASQNVQTIEELNNEDPICSSLPSDSKAIKYEENKATFLDHLAGGWAAIKYSLNCYLQGAHISLAEYLLDNLKENLLENLLEIFGGLISNILGFFVIKGLKLLWWIIKALYYVYKASTEEEGIFKWWGKAAGSAIRVVYILLSPAERRKRFKLKF